MIVVLHLPAEASWAGAAKTTAPAKETAWVAIAAKEVPAGTEKAVPDRRAWARSGDTFRTMGEGSVRDRHRGLEEERVVLQRLGKTYLRRLSCASPALSRQAPFENLEHRLPAPCETPATDCWMGC